MSIESKAMLFLLCLILVIQAPGFLAWVLAVAALVIVGRLLYRIAAFVWRAI